MKQEESLNKLYNTYASLRKEREDLLSYVEGEDFSIFLKYRDRLSYLDSQISNLNQRITELKGPTYSGERIDLYLEPSFSHPSFFFYSLSVKEVFCRIGHIKISLIPLASLGEANIGYRLSKEYQGNHYMLEALELLRTPMINLGLPKPLISVEPDNFASIRTIEKYGGVLKIPATEQREYYTYEVDLATTPKRH